MSTPADSLPSTLRLATFAPFLAASATLAASYGSSFMLADHLRANGLDVSMAGAVISTGIFTTIVCSLLAGWIAQRIGLMPTIAYAALAMAAAMLCFGSITVDTRIAYIGGLLLGVGWSVFYILAPLQLIHYLRPAARIKYLTLLSGAQMAGLGLASPFGHFIAHRTGTLSVVYYGFAAVCTLAAVAFRLVHTAMRNDPHLPTTAVGITPTLAISVLREPTWLPIVMIALAACVFTSLSTYQSTYAESRRLHTDLFFIVFTITTVVLRFTLAPAISKLQVRKLAAVLFVATFVALALFVSNPGNTPMYICATSIFAVGYGLSYSTLNSMAVNIAGEHGLSIPVTSQIFTLAYFVGLFGFPYIAGVLVKYGGINQMLMVTLVIVAANICLLAGLRRPRGKPSSLVNARGDRAI